MAKKIIFGVMVLVAAAAGYYFMSQQTQENTDIDREDVEEVVTPDPKILERERQQELRIRERARPGEFVRVEFESRRNVLGEAVVEGKLTNEAEMTAYSDLQIVIRFRNELGDFVDSSAQVIFESIEPGAGQEFRLKAKQPRRTEADVRVADATATEAG